MEDNLALIENNCGLKPIDQELIEIGSDPNFIFLNDPEFTTLRLFDVDGNIINVNSWLECANYVNGGWTNNVSDFINGERNLFFLTLGSLVIYLIYKKFVQINRGSQNLSTN